MKLIVGLGNPGKTYENTYHNLGYISIDKTAKKLGVEFSKEKFRSLVAETNLSGEKIILLKPLTYMNSSGEAIKEAVEFYKVDLKDLIVIFDDYDLPMGSVRIREFGSAGTHNGMKSVVAELSSENFPRIRVGFKPQIILPIPLIDFVLSGIKPEEKEIIEKATDIAGSAAVEFAQGVPILTVMQKYNVKGE